MYLMSNLRMYVFGGADSELVGCHFGLKGCHFGLGGGWHLGLGSVSFSRGAVTLG